MLKRRTILAGLTAVGFTLAIGTRVYGTTVIGPDAWETVYNNAVSTATTTIPTTSLLGGLLGLVFSTLSTFLNVFNSLSGFWGG